MGEKILFYFHSLGEIDFSQFCTFNLRKKRKKEKVDNRLSAILRVEQQDNSWGKTGSRLKKKISMNQSAF